MSARSAEASPTSRPGQRASPTVTASYPSPSTEGSTPTAWTVGVRNQAANPASIQFQSYAVCISP